MEHDVLWRPWVGAIQRTDLEPYFTSMGLPFPSRDEFENALSTYHDLFDRILALYLIDKGFTCTPLRIADTTEEPATPISVRAANVIDLTLERMPQPNSETDWERLFEFRNDPDSQRSLLALRRWIRQVGQGDRPASEIGEELDYLVAE